MKSSLVAQLSKEDETDTDWTEAVMEPLLALSLRNLLPIEIRTALTLLTFQQRINSLVWACI